MYKTTMTSPLSLTSTVKRLVKSMTPAAEPAMLSASVDVFDKKKVAMIIPTYKPSKTTLELIRSLRKFNPTVQVILINDCIVESTAEHRIFLQIEEMAKKDKFITCLKTTANTHKSGALNLGIAYAIEEKGAPDVIFTSDDDIIINDQTLRLMVNTLYSKKNIGAVCSRSLVKNKHENFLTRLQALEYFGFTVTKIADNNFLHGPLVMQGMLTGFRTQVLSEVKGFTVGHLIEDYDITVRVKKAGWKVAIAKDAQAWTDVPNTPSKLWRQRVRWGYWGIIVVKDHIKFLPAIFQDLLGHLVFINLLTLIVVSLLFYRVEPSQNMLIQGILFISFIQFILSYIFSIITMFSYEDRDTTDWIIRLTILPELLYTNAISFVLLGCYLYLAYNVLFNKITKRYSRLQRLHSVGLKGFERIGYVHHWGTRSPQA